jgi:hypothetical protein
VQSKNQIVFRCHAVPNLQYRDLVLHKNVTVHHRSTKTMHALPLPILQAIVYNAKFVHVAPTYIACLCVGSSEGVHVVCCAYASVAGLCVYYLITSRLHVTLTYLACLCVCVCVIMKVHMLCLPALQASVWHYLITYRYLTTACCAYLLCRQLCTPNMSMLRPLALQAYVYLEPASDEECAGIEADSETEGTSLIEWDDWDEKGDGPGPGACTCVRVRTCV